MRTPIIAGNWKMYKTPAEAEAFVRELAPQIAGFSTVERVVCPPYLAIPAVAAALAGTPVKVGAQDVHFEDEGAFTGRISPVMLKGFVEYVIMGHSECRRDLGDTDEIINKKLKAALAHGFKPIVAVGESLAQNEAGETVSFVSGQIRGAYAGVSAEQALQTVIAYEPIWAIGTGRSADAETVNAIVVNAIRKPLAALYGDDVAGQLRIQYGGSVKPNNLAEYMAQPDIDGALVGGAALKADSFTALVQIAADSLT
ncbi:MAG: triose-phosphate isomerase [Anaerolineae bacterium]|nr:triose-phosphate isomerase [Anaerolineae bacterium]